MRKFEKSKSNRVEIDIDRLKFLDKENILKTCDLIRRILNLEIINLNEYRHIPFIKDLEASPGDPIYHEEGNTLIHTQMVMDIVLELWNSGILSMYDAKILYLSALLHDIGKFETTELSNDRVRSRQHDIVGFKKSKYILDECFMVMDSFNYEYFFEIKMAVLSIIKDHINIIGLLKNSSSTMAYLNMAYRVNTRLLYLFSMCDIKGRIAKDKEESLEKLENFKKRCVNLGVFGETPQKNKEVGKLSASILIGTAASGKTTFSNIYGGEIATVLCPDKIRGELCGDEGCQEKDGLVFRELEKRIKECGKKNVNKIIIDATNFRSRKDISRKIRDAGYKISLFYFNIPFSVCKQRNEKRERVVPESVLRKQYELMVYPNFSEADEIHVVSQYSAVSEFKNTIKTNLIVDTNKPFDMTVMSGGCSLEADGEAIKIKSIDRIFDDINNTVHRNWLIHLPPTMSPCDSTVGGLGGVSQDDIYLEYPSDVYKYYKEKGIDRLIYEHKYMGSRAIIVLCRSKRIAKKYFDDSSSIGVIYSRRGRTFFDNDEIINKLHQSWYPKMKALNMDVVVVDAEILPWNLKADGLIKKQYQKTGDAGLMLYENLSESIEKHLDGIQNGYPPDKVIGEIFKESLKSLGNIEEYNNAYRFYCWDDKQIKIHPFHVLAIKYSGDDSVDFNGFNFSHQEHIDIINNVLVDNRIVFPIEYGFIDLNSEESMSNCTEKWKKYTEDGYEGFVFKPINYTTKIEDEMIQPAVKCRGRKYLRIIYGYDYLDRIEKLRRRQTKKKRRNAIAEFKLGKRSIEIFLDRKKRQENKMDEVVSEYHKYVIGILSIESEKIDPRL